MNALPEERQETALERAQRRRDEALARPITVRCADCLWEESGPVLETRRAWAAHRRDEHDDPSGFDSIGRVERPLTMAELKRNGGRRTKHVPRCKEPECRADAKHGSGLCHEHHLRAETEKRKRKAERQTPLEAIRAIPDRPTEKEPAVRTCEEIPGCTNPTVSDRGRYARVCHEHKAIVTARYAGPRGGAVPPPAPEAEPPAVKEGAEDSPNYSGAIPESGSLVEAAQRVSDLTARRQAMLAELDALETELRDAVSACENALRACAVEDVAA